MTSLGFHRQDVPANGYSGALKRWRCTFVQPADSFLHGYDAEHKHAGFWLTQLRRNTLAHSTARNPSMTLAALLLPGGHLRDEIEHLLLVCSGILR